MRILIVEDELFLSNSVEKYLRKKKFEVDTCYSGKTALEMVKKENYSIILLDIMLPEMDGLTTLKHMRDLKIDVPVILTTAKGEIEDKIIGFDIGADDYMVKPYDFDELFARIKAHDRWKDNKILVDNNHYGNLVLVRDNLSLNFEKKSIQLTLKEFNLLEYLFANHDRTISKEQIIDSIWPSDSNILPNHVEVYISYLRKKLKLMKTSVTIQTVRGVGYYLKDDNV